MYSIKYTYIKLTNKQAILEKVVNEVKKHLHTTGTEESFKHDFDITLHDNGHVEFVVTFTADYYHFEHSNEMYAKNIVFWIDGGECKIAEEEFIDQLENSISNTVNE